MLILTSVCRFPSATVLSVLCFLLHLHKFFFFQLLSRCFISIFFFVMSFTRPSPHRLYPVQIFLLAIVTSISFSFSFIFLTSIVSRFFFLSSQLTLSISLHTIYQRLLTDQQVFSRRIHVSDPNRSLHSTVCTVFFTFPLMFFVSNSFILVKVLLTPFESLI